MKTRRCLCWLVALSFFCTTTLAPMLRPALALTYAPVQKLTTFPQYPHSLASVPRLSNQGTVVWSQIVQQWSYFNQTIELFAGNTTSTCYYIGTGGDAFNDKAAPDLNTAGTVVWCTQEPERSSVYWYESSTKKMEELVVSDSFYIDPPAVYYKFDPKINTLGDIACREYFTFIEADGDTALADINTVMNYITLYRHGEAPYEGTPEKYFISAHGYINSAPQMNDKGQVVWSGAKPGEFVNHVFFYDGKTTKDIFSSSSAITNLSINDAGQIIWTSTVYAGNALYLYTGTTPKIIGYTSSTAHPYINNSSYITWDYKDEIHLYRYMGTYYTTAKLTSDAYQDRDPYLNEKGQLAWYTYNAIENISKFNIYTIASKKKETFTPDVTFSYHTNSLQLNDAAQLLWTGDDGVDHEVYLASPLVAHDFKYFYGNGDSYSGYVYAGVNDFKTMTLNQLSRTDENGKKGHYEIGGYKELAGGKKGEVYVTSYFDAEAPAPYNTFTPKNYTKPLGTKGLFSESGYILHSLNDGSDPYTWFAAKKTYYYNYFKFSSYYEADSLQSRYDFRLYYDLPTSPSSGDYYEGFFFAPVGMFAQDSKGNYIYEEIKVTPLGRTDGGLALTNGHYEIQRATAGFPFYRERMCYVTLYYDGNGTGSWVRVDDTYKEVPKGIFVSDWTRYMEDGYAINGTSRDRFNPWMPADVDSDSFSFVVFGDSQTSYDEFLKEYLFDWLGYGEAIPTQSLYNVMRAMIERTVYPPQFGVFLGDLGNWAQNEEEIFWKDWHTTCGEFFKMANIPLYLAMGNHDYYEINNLGDEFCDFFDTSYTQIWLIAGLAIIGALTTVLTGAPIGVPEAIAGLGYLYEKIQSKADELGVSFPDAAHAGADYASEQAMYYAEALDLQKKFSEWQEYYSLNKNKYSAPLVDVPYNTWEKGNSYFIVLDSFSIDPVTGKRYYQEVSDSQLKQLKIDLDNHKEKEHIFLFSHYPALSTRGKKVDTDLWNLLNKYPNVQAYFAADEHLYSRASVTDAVYKYACTESKVGSAYQPITNTITQFISGGAGAPPDSGACGGALIKNWAYNNHIYQPVDWPVQVSHIGEDGYAVPPHYLRVSVDGADVNVEARDVFSSGGDITSLTFDKTTLSGDALPKAGAYSCFEYTYFYGNSKNEKIGEHYDGVVYAPSDKYAVGQLIYSPYTLASRPDADLQDENGTENGYYQITRRMDLGSDGSKNGQVMVYSYYDKETGRALAPMSNTKPLGTNYLGSEGGYLAYYAKDNNRVYQFGQGFHFLEAEALPPKTTKYSYEFVYTNGDRYKGYFYDASSRYHMGDVIIPTWRNFGEVSGQNVGGTYTITNAVSGFAYNLDGQVFVETYYDKATNKFYTPLNSTQPLGRESLGSEEGYLLSNKVSTLLFGHGRREADICDTYAYRYTYLNGDFYEGTVYGAPDCGYYKGWTANKKNELGFKGEYLITGQKYTGVAASYYGKVTVSSYYDGDASKKLFRFSLAPFTGGTYLGSESGYVVRSGVKDYSFGQGYNEADVGDTYLFRHYYGNGDYYEGYVYRTPGVGYYPGWKVTRNDETGKPGYYEILSMSYTGATAKYNQVFVHTYYDAESRKNYTPVHKGTAVGTALLGSELDYIVKDSVVAYKFGKNYYEADVGDRYTFKYTYGNGDYYLGTVYRNPAVGYYPGWKSTPKVNESGQLGYYEILSMSYTGATAKYNQVFVNTYHDGESKKDFEPINKYNAVGTALLGSELNYIIKYGVEAYKFGKNNYEADACDTYTFKYTYGNGDYYLGTVFRPPGPAYYTGWKTTQKANETGKLGYYNILDMSYTGATARYNLVYVSEYCDGDRATPKTFTWVSSTTPLGAQMGTALLGSESGYILTAGIPAHYFGKGYYEADE